MRVAFALALGSLLFIAVPAAACGGSGTAPEQESYQYCHDYTIHVGDESRGAHANEKGQFYVATGEFGGSLLGSRETWYFEQDVDYTDPENEHFFSFWWYFESNGRPGAQRADEVCNNTPEGEQSDGIFC